MECATLKAKDPECIVFVKFYYSGHGSIHRGSKERRLNMILANPHDGTIPIGYRLRRLSSMPNVIVSAILDSSRFEMDSLVNFSPPSPAEYQLSLLFAAWEGKNKMMLADRS